MAQIFFNFPKNFIYLLLYTISLFFDGLVPMFFHSIFKDDFQIHHLYLIYIIHFGMKSLTYFIYRLQTNNLDKRSNSESHRLRKTKFLHNYKFITSTAIIEVCLKFFLFQYINRRPNIDCMMIKFDLKFFFFGAILVFGGNLVGYYFYKQHYIALLIILFCSLLQYVSVFRASHDRFYKFILMRIPLMGTAEILIAVKELIENYILRENNVNIFLILSSQGIIEIFLGLIIFTYIIFTDTTINNSIIESFEKIISQGFKLILVIFIMLLNDIFRININYVFTAYHRGLCENFIIAILTFIFTRRHSSIRFFLSSLMIIISFCATLIFCDIIEINFGEGKHKKNYENNKKKNILLTGDYDQNEEEIEFETELKE